MPLAVHYFTSKPLHAAVNTTAVRMHTLLSFEIGRSTFLILDADFVTEITCPITLAIKVVGPIIAKLAKPIPLKIKQFIANNNKGTIIVSFGSVLSILKVLADLKTFIDTFNRLPCNVLWKNTNNSDYPIADSVKLVQWLP